MSASRHIGEVLLRRRALSEDDLARILEEEQRTGTSLPALVARDALVPEAELVAAMAESMGLPFIDLSVAPLSPAAAEAVPEVVAREYLCVGVEYRDRDLVVAFADPTDHRAVEAVRHATGSPVVPAAAVRHDLLRVIHSLYGAGVEAVGSSGNGQGAGDGDPEASSPAMTIADIPAETDRSPTEAGPGTRIHLDDLLERVVELGGSDLHLTVGTPPTVRIHGDLHRLAEYPALTNSEIRGLMYAVLSQRHRERFEDDLELDTSYSLPGKGRFRVNVFMQRDSVGAVMRAIPHEIVPFDDLGLPEAVKSFATLPRGLVLVTGPTGSGKSTTLASLIDIINSERAMHIMTVEDPIEFLHRHKRAVVNQREVGEDTRSFAAALKHVLRQDPDVILVGEMRDLETIATAITAAETGHLVFGTLHTQDAPQSIDRVIDVFPAHQQQQVRVQLAGALQGVVTQQLVPRADGKGRVVAADVLVITPAMRNLIREAKVHQIYSLMQAGGRHGMVTMDQALASLVKARKIAFEVAVERCHDTDELRRLAGR